MHLRAAFAWAATNANVFEAVAEAVRLKLKLKIRDNICGRYDN